MATILSYKWEKKLYSFLGCIVIDVVRNVCFFNLFYCTFSGMRKFQIAEITYNSKNMQNLKNPTHLPWSCIFLCCCCTNVNFGPLLRVSELHHFSNVSKKKKTNIKFIFLLFLFCRDHSKAGMHKRPLTIQRKLQLSKMSPPTATVCPSDTSEMQTNMWYVEQFCKRALYALNLEFMLAFKFSYRKA